MVQVAQIKYMMDIHLKMLLMDLLEILYQIKQQEQNLKKIEIEAQQQVKQAEAEKQAKIIKAEAEKEAQQLQAEALRIK